MKAIVWTKYGSADGLELQEVEKPVPKANEVLIKIHATTVTAGDCEMRKLKLPIEFRLIMRLYIGPIKPGRIKILGQELAGEIEITGPAVKQFKAGDPVFAATGFGFGAHAEYKCLPETGVIAIKPANMSYEEAAAVPVGALTALGLLRQGNIRKGQEVLIYGASGSIGTFAVQLTSYFGAKVSAVCGPQNLELVKSLGAFKVFDYTKEDFTRNSAKYDIIFDTLGKTSFTSGRRSLKAGGRYLLANPGLVQKFGWLWAAFSSRKAVIGGAPETQANLIFLKELIEAGQLRSVIDRCYPLEQVAEAQRYVEKGHKKGNVAITVNQASQIHPAGGD